MNSNILVEIELAKYSWSEILEADGLATEVPDAIREMLSAHSDEEADRAYWKLENGVVLQGFLFEAAEPVVPVLMAALVDPNRPPPVRESIYELLFQILKGETHGDAVARGKGDISKRCKIAAREGLWLFYRDCLGDQHKPARQIIKLLGSDSARLEILEKMKGSTLEK